MWFAKAHTNPYIMNNKDDFILIQKHLRDLADRSYKQDMYTFSSFLSIAELDAYYTIERELSYASPKLFGGYESAERMLVRFGNEETLGYTQDPPIVCIHITPLMEKFADNLSHRDFLGALMNLGIERSVLGDIKAGDKQAYLFCLDSMSDYICENLDQVKHTHVKCRCITEAAEFPKDEPRQLVIQVASERADALISKVYNLSRNDSLELFRAGKVFINGRLCENNSKAISIGDIINARGYGKFKVVSEPTITKKGKLTINIEAYL